MPLNNTVLIPVYNPSEMFMYVAHVQGACNSILSGPLLNCILYTSMQGFLTEKCSLVIPTIPDESHLYRILYREII
jgi:hypothetical protein